MKKSNKLATKSDLKKMEDKLKKQDRAEDSKLYVKKKTPIKRGARHNIKKAEDYIYG